MIQKEVQKESLNKNKNENNEEDNEYNEYEDNRRFKAEFYRTYGLYSGAGLQLAVAVSLGAFGGHYLDQKLATKPLCLILGLLLGMAGGFMNLFFMFKAQKDSTQTRKRLEKANSDSSKTKSATRT